MRRYSLASTEARKDVDLRDYANIIIAAVKEYMPNAYVEVSEDN